MHRPGLCVLTEVRACVCILCRTVPMRTSRTNTVCSQCTLCVHCEPRRLSTQVASVVSIELQQWCSNWGKREDLESLHRGPGWKYGVKGAICKNYSLKTFKIDQQNVERIAVLTLWRLCIVLWRYSNGASMLISHERPVLFRLVC